MQNLSRRQEAHQKIKLGGLIKKAGIDEEPTAVILGLLLEAADTLQSQEADVARKRWRLLGDIALTH